MTETQATVRPAESGDAEAIARLITLLGYPCTAEQMEARLAAMAQEDQHVIGIRSKIVHFAQMHCAQLRI